MSTERFLEYASSSRVRADRAAAILYGVKIVGHRSANGRTYTAAALTSAAPLYEGAKVNVNHANSRRPRSYAERIGRLQNVRAEKDGLYADLHFNPKHPLAEQLIWDADNYPQAVGLSHDVHAHSSQPNVIDEILQVNSVDLVTDPATTNGLFEGKEDDQPGDYGDFQRDTFGSPEPKPEFGREVLGRGEDDPTDFIQSIKG